MISEDKNDFMWDLFFFSTIRVDLSALILTRSSPPIVLLDDRP